MSLFAQDNTGDLAIEGFVKVAATYGTVQLSVELQDDGICPVGAFVQNSTTGDLWVIVQGADAIGAAGGAYDVIAKAYEPGFHPTAPGEIDTIITPSFGWDAVTNLDAPIPGAYQVTGSRFYLEKRPDYEVAQRLTNRFRLVRGEWEFDTRQGTPYFEAIFGQKQSNLPSVQALCARIAAETPGVQQVLFCVATMGPNRSLRVDLSVRAQGGALIAGQIGAPFIVEFDQEPTI